LLANVAASDNHHYTRPPPLILIDARLSSRSSRNIFSSKGHNPSSEQWSALSSLIDCMERITTGRTDRKVFLSSLDPGIGKTSALQAFVRSTLRDPAFSKTGILICINNYREIEAFASALIEEFPDRIGVWITKDKNLTDPATIEKHELAGLLLGLTLTDNAQAQVLITTHERITREMKDHGSFELAEGLHFNGRPRVLRVWDEAWSPSLPITINAWRATRVLSCFAEEYPALASQLNAFLQRVLVGNDGDNLQVPDYVEQYDFDRHSFLEVGPEGNDEDAELLEFLYAVSGKSVAIRKDGKRGSTMLTFKDVMPTNIAPLVVLDASGRVRVFYDDLRERGVIHMLKSATKNYRPLQVHHWDRGGGKSAFRDPGSRPSIIEGIAKTIASGPLEAWLVVHHREGRGVPDLRPLIREKVDQLCTGDVRPLVRFLSWGMHRASNAFVDVSNVVLAGLLILPPSAYDAGKRIGAGLRPRWGKVTDLALSDYQLGEHASDILQALCRTSVRRSVGEYCGHCNAYLISKGHDVPNILKFVFPGIEEIKSWRPVVLKMTERQQSVFDIIEKWARTAHKGERLRFNKVQAEVGIADTSDFARLRQSSALTSALASIGVFEVGNKRKTSWALLDIEKQPEATASDYGFDDEEDEAA
jgi:hypothetical protein